MLHVRLVGSGDCSERDTQPVPAIDRRDGQRQILDFFGAELFLHPLVNVVGRVAFRDQRDRLGPFERRSFAFGIERGLSPGG